MEKFIVQFYQGVFSIESLVDRFPLQYLLDVQLYNLTTRCISTPEIRICLKFWKCSSSRVLMTWTKRGKRETTDENLKLEQTQCALLLETLFQCIPINWRRCFRRFTDLFDMFSMTMLWSFDHVHKQYQNRMWLRNEFFLISNCSYLGDVAFDWGLALTFCSSSLKIKKMREN